MHCHLKQEIIIHSDGCYRGGAQSTVDTGRVGVGLDVTGFLKEVTAEPSRKSGAEM